MLLQLFLLAVLTSPSLEECTGGQVQNSCGSPCPSTCDDPWPTCIAVCEDRCECPDNLIWHEGQCIELYMCPNNSQTKCPVGHYIPDIFCGRGPERQDCPDFHYCVVEPADSFAVCCPKVEGICQVGEHIPNIFCGNGRWRQDCPESYNCQVEADQEYAVCCPQTKYCSGGQVQNTCGSPCTSTCVDPWPTCMQVCENRCECPDDLIWHEGQCIEWSMCPNKTEMLCPVGDPLPDVFCGLGPSSEYCPDSHFCNVEPADGFAVCCPRFIVAGAPGFALSLVSLVCGYLSTLMLI